MSWLLSLANLLGLSWLLQLHGIALRPIAEQDELAATNTKRKLKEEDEEGREERKRWRGDRLYAAIQDFVTKMWGVNDTNDNIVILPNINERSDEESEDGQEESFWKQKPVLNFAKVKVQFGDSTPSRVIQDLNQNVEEESEKSQEEETSDTT